ncbi:sterol desaturase family protein [Litorivivens sp.]|uniref:sterol desaturase family protein n=1 Tax=Litorivivens sp. TaxID=2020868 RepID=UPI003565EFC8
MPDLTIKPENLVLLFIVVAMVWEVLAGRTRDGRKTREDWNMALLTATVMVLVQRPALVLVTAFIGGLLVPQWQGVLAGFEAANFWWVLLGYIALEEFLHGIGHWFAHARRPKSQHLQRLQALFKMGHRPHHLSGGNDGRGQLSVTQTFVEHWLWWFIMPNYWFQFFCVYLGLTEVFLVGTAIKGLWAAHNHVNWNYDLYFLNHPRAWVRKTMYGLCHILTFPTQHHHHHARGKNSGSNLCNLLAIYDWLVFDSLVIEREKPAIYGWKQSPEEEHSVLTRFLATDLAKLRVSKPASKPVSEAAKQAV